MLQAIFAGMVSTLLLSVVLIVFTDMSGWIIFPLMVILLITTSQIPIIAHMGKRYFTKDGQKVLWDTKG